MKGARDYSCVYMSCRRLQKWLNHWGILRHMWQTIITDMHCMHLQKVGVCIWSWGTLCYTFRSGTARSVGLWPSCCSLQMDRPGTDNSPYGCTALSPRSWNSRPEKKEQTWERKKSNHVDRAERSIIKTTKSIQTAAIWTSNRLKLICRCWPLTQCRAQDKSNLQIKLHTRNISQTKWALNTII